MKEDVKVDIGDVVVCVFEKVFSDYRINDEFEVVTIGDGHVIGKNLKSELVVIPSRYIKLKEKSNQKIN